MTSFPQNASHSVIQGDCIDYLPQLTDNEIDCVISDIPYGIGLDDWDVLHNNTNSALLGQSPAQQGKSGFKRRGKPIRGWSSADRNIPREYQDWCYEWAKLLYPKVKNGASLFIFCARRTMHRAVIALEDSGFLVKDVLIWEKPAAHHRAQRLSGVLENRGLHDEAQKWAGWRLGNLAPIWEPIVWLFKPYKVTITDNVIENQLGAINIEATQVHGKSPTNILKFGFADHENRLHEAQKPVELLKFLLTLTTIEGQTVLDPFAGSGSTGVACRLLNRQFIGFEINPAYVQMANERLNEVAPAQQAAKPSDVTQQKLGI
jgi:site-specific DNA-methyltransferase (adenine-specific)